jgi:hypothetical protein
VLQLLDKCLQHLDSSFYAYLRTVYYDTSVPIASFSAHDWEPGKVVKLWDLFLSHGLHLNVLSVLSQMLLNRGVIMGGTRYAFLFICCVVKLAYECMEQPR